MESQSFHLVEAARARMSALEASLAGGEPAPVAETVRELVACLRAGVPAQSREAVFGAALALCRNLFNRSRSLDALPLGREVLGLATACGDRFFMRRAATACGLLASDNGDLVAAIEYHVQALRLATHEDDRVEMSRTWNNIGAATAVTGNYEMAARCFRRAIALVEHVEEPVYSRYTASNNLADSLYKLGRGEEGLRWAERALLELTPEFRDQDLHGAILVRRNLVRLLVAVGRVGEAAHHVTEAAALAERAPARARIAADTLRADFEIACGQVDIALTRLDKALAAARENPSALHDTLACAIRGEEAAGNAARALLRMEELSELVYRSGIERAREHVRHAGLDDVTGHVDEQEREHAKARLISKLDPPAQPESWKSLQRLGVGAVMRMDPTGWHGVRVGALTRALANACGLPALQALEVGLAAELHDIGLTAVPAAILAKPGPLNDAERAIVRRHSEAGAQMLADARHARLLLARDIARYHHAHWDGRGYPERVGGEFIPLGARMCAIADAYDVMVCGLAAREPRSMGEALEELRREAGRQFDPELVDCFDEMIRSESEGRGMDLSTHAGMDDFQELVLSLKEDRGFV